MNNESSWHQVAVFGLVVWSFAMLWLCWHSGAQHDYAAYLMQWNKLLRGGDPWKAGNAYGPLHTFIGFFRYLDPLAPKLFMAGTLIAANAALAMKLLNVRGARPILIVYLIAIPTNVLIIGEVFIYGLNDAIVAALLVAAVLMRYQSKFFICGVFVGLAALTKYYPLLLLPFFALDHRKVRWNVIYGGVFVFLFGVLLALAIWGDGPLRAMAYGSERTPKLLSVLEAVSKLFGKGSIDFFIQYNSVFVISGVFATLLVVWKARLNWLEGTVIGYLVMLTLYKVGNQQFYIPWLFVVASLPLLARRSSDIMAVVFLPAILLLSLYQFGYQFGSERDLYGSGYKGEWSIWIREYGGFIAFPVSVASLAAYFLYLSRIRVTELRFSKNAS